MTDIYGQSTDNGQEIIYHDAQGRLVPGVVRNLWPPLYRADLEVRYPDGTTRFVEGAAFNDGPGPGGWKHAQASEAASSTDSSADQDAQASDGQDQAAQAPAAKKKGSK
jgi:hypothetical protein